MTPQRTTICLGYPHTVTHPTINCNNVVIVMLCLLIVNYFFILFNSTILTLWYRLNNTLWQKPILAEPSRWCSFFFEFVYFYLYAVAKLCACYLHNFYLLVASSMILYTVFWALYRIYIMYFYDFIINWYSIIYLLIIKISDLIHTNWS